MATKILDVSDLDQDEYSEPFFVKNGDLVAFYAVWTAASDAPTGNLNLQFSHDHKDGKAVTSSTWTQLSKEGSNVAFGTSPAGSAGSTAEVFSDLVGWCRVHWEETNSASGTNESMEIWMERGARK